MNKEVLLLDSLLFFFYCRLLENPIKKKGLWKDVDGQNDVEELLEERLRFTRINSVTQSSASSFFFFCPLRVVLFVHHMNCELFLSGN